ncbi:MAG: hypothetical protein ACR2RE_15310, partial [Geminicoccaceae bacterium]
STWSRLTNNITLIHGVSFHKVTSTITKDTPPNYAYTKLSSSPGATGKLATFGNAEGPGMVVGSVCSG